jgi:hypothetical protein
VSRHRPSSVGQWLHAVGVAAAYLVVAAGLFWLDLGDAGVAPVWAVVAVPPFYGVISLLLLPRASLTRRLSWVGGACLTHLSLGLAAAAAFSMVADVTPLSALAHAFARLGPVPALTLVATPFALAPFRGRVLTSRPTARPGRTRQPGVLASTTPGETPFAREPRRRESSAEEPAPVPVPAPAAAPRAAAEAAAESPAAVPDLPSDDAVVRVRFERVAGQLPAGAFTLPLDRVAESLREPHWLTVPRRVVLAQLPEGAVQVDWPVLASQFPPLAFAMSDVEFRRKYPDLKLTLPLDDVLRQLPRGMFSMDATPSPIAGLEAFPPPFQPLSVPRDLPPASAPAPARAATTGDAPDLPTGVVLAPAPVRAPAAPALAAPAPVMVAPSPAAAPAVAPPPPPVMVAPPPAVAPVVAPPPPPPPAAPPPVAAAAPRRDAAAEVISRDALTRLAACLAGAGTFESWSGVVDGTALVAFVSPTMSRDAVTAVAVRVAGLLGAAAGEQVTVRTARAAIIVSAAPTPVVVAARRPGAPVALLELRAARAAGLAGRAGEGAAPPSRSLSALAVEPRVAGVAGTLTAFGIVEPAVLTDSSGAARVYVFREPGREAERLGELALAVWEGLGRAREGDLGALVSVVFRQGRRRILVRSVGARGTALLAAAGPVARPGRAWRDADRAAAALETR